MPGYRELRNRVRKDGIAALFKSPLPGLHDPRIAW
jgi:hypothetical protein